jgi:hypothetical protein
MQRRKEEKKKKKKKKVNDSTFKSKIVLRNPD